MLTDQLISKQSKDIAGETRKDSVSMKTIAAVTMAFLPATFLATVFSMGFFHIDPDRNTLVVNQTIWIYFVTAVILTAFTTVVWLLLSKYGLPSLGTLRNVPATLGGAFRNSRRRATASQTFKPDVVGKEA